MQRKQAQHAAQALQQQRLWLLLRQLAAAARWVRLQRQRVCQLQRLARWGPTSSAWQSMSCSSGSSSSSTSGRLQMLPAMSSSSQRSGSEQAVQAPQQQEQARLRSGSSWRQQQRQMVMQRMRMHGLLLQLLPLLRQH
jgi:hypothetical protein